MPLVPLPDFSVTFWGKATAAAAVLPCFCRSGVTCCDEASHAVSMEMSYQHHYMSIVSFIVRENVLLLAESETVGQNLP